MTRKHFERYQGQTRVKHLILDNYFRAWGQILSSWSKKLVYLDGFCGTGTYYDADGTSHDGSPIIALRIADELAHRAQTYCIFTDADEDFCAELSAKLATMQFKSAYHVEAGDFDTHINTILDQVERMAPAFVFVDPCGWTGYPMKTIERIMQRSQTEVLINFMYNAINEWLTAPSAGATFEALYGMAGDELATFLASLEGLSPEQREHRIRDRYITELRKRARYVFPFKVKFPGKDRTYFYLIHATNHFKGLHVMKDVMFKAAGGSLDYAALGKNDSQIALFDEAPTQRDLAEYLLQRFAGKTETFQGIMERTYQETPFRETDYRAVLKQMEKGGKVTVARVDSKTARGLSGRDRVAFL